MKIKGPGRVSTGRIEKTKNNKSADKGAFDKALNVQETTSAGAMSGTAPITSVNSLLSLQESPTATDERSKGIQHAQGLIEQLETIRHGLLLGQIPVNRLQNIVRILEAQREKNKDPKLVEIINDIELRAKVELAKLGIL